MWLCQALGLRTFRPVWVCLAEESDVGGRAGGTFFAGFPCPPPRGQGTEVGLGPSLRCLASPCPTGSV